MQRNDATAHRTNELGTHIHDHLVWIIADKLNVQSLLIGTCVPA